MTVEKKQTHPLVKFTKTLAIIFFVMLALFHVLVGKLVFGWILFLRRAIPQVDINIEILLQAIVAIVLLLIGGHSLLKWIYEHRTQKQWRKKWTLGLVITAILLFVGGTASVGIVTFGEVTAQHGITSGYGSYRYDRTLHYDAPSVIKHTGMKEQHMEIIYSELRNFSLVNDYIERNFFRSFDEDFQYLFAISKDYSLGAIIRAPITTFEVEEHFTDVIFYVQGQQRQRRLYKRIPLDQLITSIENGVIPPGGIVR